MGGMTHLEMHGAHCTQAGLQRCTLIKSERLLGTGKPGPRYGREREFPLTPSALAPSKCEAVVTVWGVGMTHMEVSLQLGIQIKSERLPV